VHRGGQEIGLARLSFDLLLTLIRAAPDVVTPDELMTRVWPGLVVSPETVSQRIKLLRSALDDDSKNPRYIASIRGRGYRIVAPVTVATAEGSTTTPASPPLAGSVATAPQPRARSFRPWLLAAVTGAIAGCHRADTSGCASKSPEPVPVRGFLRLTIV
jgi:DNA-binding winged helix-turn-helix (wHTH) protein